MIGSSSKLNAAGMAPEHSMVLPQRQPSSDEQMILNTLEQLYASASPNQSSFLSIFAPDCIYSSPRGDVFVGHSGLSKLLERPAGIQVKLQQRLLTTPDTLASSTMVIDQVAIISSEFGTDENNSNSQDLSSNTTTRSLIVLKRRQGDGLVTHFTEEEGHRRATAPLAARAASVANFYSPTDNMVSPCTSKLNLAKRKHHSKAKPMTLFASQMANAGPAHRQGSNMSSNSADMDF
ncbi:unnamed protein product [Sympodiomycopsis kandeliae]